MKQISSTRAKQNFGELLSAATLGPVAIEKHGKVQAIVAPPQFFTAAQTSADGIEARRLARLGQTVIDKNRFIRHQRIALDLVTAQSRVNLDALFQILEEARKLSGQGDFVVIGSLSILGLEADFDVPKDRAMSDNVSEHALQVHEQLSGAEFDSRCQ